MILTKIKKYLDFFLNYLLFGLLKLVKKNPIRVYYWKDHPNFGDLLTPALLKFYGFYPLFFYPHRAQLVSTGSLIEHINPDYKGIILGSGAISETANVHFKNAKILGLRGKLTKSILKINDEITYGDPGLLASNLLKKRSLKKYTIGIVPHYSDLENQIIWKLKEKYTSQISIIDVQNPPETVLSEIDECEYILSSSLHGLICSDSLGIPNRWIQLSTLHGGDFKFRDYYSLFEISSAQFKLIGAETIDELINTTSLVDQTRLNVLKNNLENSFKNLSIQIYG